MRRSLGLVLAVAAVAALALPALPSSAAASPPLAVADPKGDAIDQRASMDIVGLSYEVKLVKQVRSKDPSLSLVVKMTLAGPPETQLAQYQALAEVPGCGHFEFSYRPGTVFSAVTGSSSTDFFVSNCTGDEIDGSDLIDLRPDVVKNTITWTIAIDSIPKKTRAMKKLVDISGRTGFAEPVIGIYGNGELDFTDGPLPTDSVSTPKEFFFA